MLTCVPVIKNELSPPSQLGFECGKAEYYHQDEFAILNECYAQKYPTRNPLKAL